MRLLAVAAVFSAVPLLAAAQAPGTAGQLLLTRSASRPVVPAPTEKTVTLPLRQVALYKNGVGYFEQAGQVSGDALIRLDATTEQLNDMLDSLTATDLGGGHIAGAGFHTAEGFRQQLEALHLGPDPTVLDLLHAIRGARVEVRSSGGSVTGKLLNVEVRLAPQPGARNPAHSPEPVERRFLSLLTTPGGLRTVELTPATEVRLLDSPQRDEIGRYLEVLATSHTTALRHLTLEDRGTGDREVRVNYINAMPAWKSSYRVLFGNTMPARTARVQGWAVVDNTSSVPWKDVQLTLVSGAAGSFTQPMSQPERIDRPVVALPGAVPSPGRTPQFFGGAEGAAIPMDASAMGGGAGVQIQRARSKQTSDQPSGQTGDQTTSAGVDDLFAYKLSRPVTLLRDESTTIPLFETELEAERVSLWLSRQPNPALVQRALSLRNTSRLTLDPGAFSITEDGIFGGEGVLPLLHPGERRLAPYGSDGAVHVQAEQPRQQPAEVTHHVEAADGTLSVHRTSYLEHDYTVGNAAAEARTVVLGISRSQPPARQGPWLLSRQTPADEVVDAASDRVYRFHVEVGPAATASVKVVETHTHPTRYKLAELSIADFENLLREAGAIPGLPEQVTPILDLKRHLAGLEEQEKDTQRSIDEVSAEEARIRKNIAALKGSAEERPLAEHLSNALLAQEAKLAPLQERMSSLTAQRFADKKQLTARFHDLRFDLRLNPAQPEDGSTGASAE